MSGGVTPTPVLPGDTPPKVIVNGFSANGYAPAAFGVQQSMKNIACGALVANTLATVLNLTGPGVLVFLGVAIADNTSRTLRMQLIIDGVTVFDSTSAANATFGNGAWIVGNYITTGPTLEFDTIPFRSSCVLKLASSLSETDKFNVGTVYRTS